MTSFSTSDQFSKGMIVRQGIDVDYLTVGGNAVTSGGPTGPAGPTGPSGVTGPTGPQGASYAVGNNLTAAGTSISNALQLTAGINVISTAASGTGVILPAAPTIGSIVYIYNNGANPIKVYATSQTIDGTAGATGVTLTNAKRAIYTYLASGTWNSAQLGVASA
jgi:hypothetical protein